MPDTDPTSEEPREAGEGEAPRPAPPADEAAAPQQRPWQLAFGIALVLVLGVQFYWLASQLRSGPPSAPTPQGQPLAAGQPVAAGEPDGRRQGPEDRPEFGRLVAGLMMLETSPLPLSASQRSQFAALMGQYEKSKVEVGKAVASMYDVLSPAQRTLIRELQANLEPPEDIIDRPGTDPFLEWLIREMEKKAGGSPAAPATPVPSPADYLERQGVVEGLLYLQTRSDKRLSPGQARTVLDAARKIRDEMGRALQQEGEMFRILSSEQQAWIRQQSGSMDRQATAPRLLLRWLESGRPLSSP